VRGEEGATQINQEERPKKILNNIDRKIDPKI